MKNKLVYFFPDDTNIKLYKKILKHQGNEVCRDVITRQWIKDSVSKLSFGIAKYKKNTRNNKKIYSLADEYYLQGFISCRTDIEGEDILWIDIVCTREKSSYVKQLINESIEYTKNNLPTIRLIQLFTSNDIGLINWYKSIGFKASVLYSQFAPPNTCIIRMFLDKH